MAVREGIEKIMTFQMLAKSLHVSMATLYKWRDEGLPTFMLGRQRAVYEDDVVQFLRSQAPEIRGAGQEQQGASE